jgi:hypothetical protein
MAIADVEREQRRVVERRHERRDEVRQGEGVGHQEERHADRQEGDRAQRIAPAEDEVGEHDAEREGDRELVQVAPRPATDQVAADEHAQPDEHEAGPHERLGHPAGGCRTVALLAAEAERRAGRSGRGDGRDLAPAEGEQRRVDDEQDERDGERDRADVDQVVRDPFETHQPDSVTRWLPRHRAAVRDP